MTILRAHSRRMQDTYVYTVHVAGHPHVAHGNDTVSCATEEVALAWKERYLVSGWTKVWITHNHIEDIPPIPTNTRYANIRAH